MYNILNLDLNGDSDMLTESTYLIKIEMVDGTTQLAQITKEQAIALGIEFSDVATEEKPPIEHIKTEQTFISSDNINSKAPTKYNYRVIHPEELNLKPSNAALRGRPKKRPQEVVKAIITPPKIVKPARTRSGRLTRPPIHMERDFEKILTDSTKNEDNSTKDVSTKEFGPLTTNDSPLPVEAVVKPPEKKKKKRSIPSQYRCSTCHKAYLGRNRMAQHLRKHPDHGIENQVVEDDCEAWGYLIDISLKAKDGQKGSKFCTEIINLIRNARTLVKYFFKPVRNGRSAEYYVDSFLASILNIQEGDYRFNENELCKDISIFSFLEFFDDTFAHIIKTGSDETNCVINNQPIVHTPIVSTVKTNEKRADDANLPKATVDLHFGSDIMDVIKENNTVEHHNKFNNLLYNFSSDSNSKLLDKTKTGFINLFECADLTATSTPTQQQQDKEEKNDFHNLFDSLYVNEKNTAKDCKILNDVVDHLIAADDKTKADHLLSSGDLNIMDSSHVDDDKSNFDDALKKNVSGESKKADVVYDLHKLHLLSADISDELILPDHPGTSNLLDTSTNSDDIMNVDQFVNERFKRLTETDVVVGGLELPALDCFNFTN